MCSRVGPSGLIYTELHLCCAQHAPASLASDITLHDMTSSIVTSTVRIWRLPVILLFCAGSFSSSAHLCDTSAKQIPHPEIPGSDLTPRGKQTSHSHRLLLDGTCQKFQDQRRITPRLHNQDLICQSLQVHPHHPKVKLTQTDYTWTGTCIHRPAQTTSRFFSPIQTCLTIPVRAHTRCSLR